MTETELRRRIALEVHRIQRHADSERVSRERARLTFALLLSLLIHAVLLSLAFGGQGTWGLVFPWQDRRIEVPDLRVDLVPAQVTAAEPAVAPVAEPSQQAAVEQPAGNGPALNPSVSAPTPTQTTAAIMPRTNPSIGEAPKADAANGTAPPLAPLPADRPGDTAPPPVPAPAVIALDRTDEPTWFVPSTPAPPPSVAATVPGAASAETTMPPPRDAGDTARDQEVRERAVEPAKIDPTKQEAQRQAEQRQAERDAARREAARQEAARAEKARLQAEREDAARQATELKEAARQVNARQDAARLAATRLDGERSEVARQAIDLQDATRQVAARQEAVRADAAKIETASNEAAKIEAARIEAARIEAAKVEAAKVEAAKVEAAKAEAAKVEAARAETARNEAAKIEAAQEATARLEAARRAIGRQLDEEAARRDAAASAGPRSPSSSGVRRYRLFGRADANADLVLYAEAWARKIQLNMTFDMVREAAKQPHVDPLVTVAVRSDGSVESVIFVQSSGVPAIDEAIRRVVQSQTPYEVFPPNMAREWDVIEIRRTWHFDVAIRLY